MILHIIMKIGRDHRKIYKDLANNGIFFSPQFGIKKFLLLLIVYHKEWHLQDVQLILKLFIICYCKIIWENKFYKSQYQQKLDMELSIRNY